MSNTSNYVIGKGTVEINGRYLGNTSRMSILVKGKKMLVVVDCDDISQDNLALFFDAQKEPLAALVYTSRSPTPGASDIKAEGRLVEAEFVVKDGEGQNWQIIRYTIEAEHVRLERQPS